MSDSYHLRIPRARFVEGVGGGEEVHDALAADEDAEEFAGEFGGDGGGVGHGGASRVAAWGLSGGDWGGTTVRGLAWPCKGRGGGVWVVSISPAPSFPGDRADTLLGLAGNLARSLDLSTLELAQVREALLGYLPRHQYLLIELQTLDPSLDRRDRAVEEARVQIAEG